MAFYDSASSNSFYYYNPTPGPYHETSYSYYYTPYPSEIEFLQPSSYTRLIISHSVSPTDFDEYDPTPYGGGYDQAATYGKPLPPSDAICYPRTSPPKSDVISPEPHSYDSTPPPYGKDAEKPQVEVKPREEPQVVESGGDDYYQKVYGKGRYFYGSGFESVDLCDGLFGYWPCWAKREAEEEQERWRENSGEENGRREDPHPWELCAEYFFGPGEVNCFDDYADHSHQYQNNW